MPLEKNKIRPTVTLTITKRHPKLKEISKDRAPKIHIFLKRTKVYLQKRTLPLNLEAQHYLTKCGHDSALATTDTGLLLATTHPLQPITTLQTDSLLAKTQCPTSSKGVQKTNKT